MEPITRKERYLDAIVKGNSCDIMPITREERYLYCIANKIDIDLQPTTREEVMLFSWNRNRSSVSLQDKTFTANGVYTADEGYDGFGTVTVAIKDGNSIAF